MKLIGAVLVFCLGATHATAADGPVRLSLKEAIRSAVEKNLDVQAELYNPAIAEAEVRQSRGIYDTRLTMLTSYQDSTTQPVNFVVSGSEQRIFEANPGVSQLVPIGGTLGLTFNNTFNNNNFPTSRNNYWQSAVTLSLTQPLLKNFGRDTTELAINIASSNKEGSLDRFKTRLIETIFQVRNEYYRLYTLREELEVAKTSLQLAQKILSDTQARVKAGVLPAMEILNAEFGVAAREKDLIDAEKAVKDQEDVLRVLLQMPDVAEIIPIDTPSRDRYSVNGDEAIQRALAIRPELAEQRTNLRINELETRATRNRTLPELNLSTSVALTGLDRRYDETMDQIGTTNFPVWFVGL